MRERQAWRRMSEAEVRAAQPFLIDVSGLDRRSAAQIRADYLLACVSGVRLIASELGRAPTNAEVEMLRGAVARHFNCHLVPALIERQSAPLQ